MPSRSPRPLTAALAVILLGFSVAACKLPSRYDVATVVDDLENPWDASFAPDGSLFFTERVGDINVLRGGQVTSFDPPGDVAPRGEGGMMGIAVDPGFDSNRRIYTCYITATDVRVVRWEVSADWTRLENGVPLVTNIPAATNGRHSGCRTRFGPDGMLWVTTGDAADPTNPQNLSSLGGKVLRIGTEPPADPAVDPLASIYAYGFRNPQGISFRPNDGKPFLIEHGPTCDDEITPLVAGGNGGWDPVAPGSPGFYNESVPMTDFGKFPGALPPSWSSGCPTIAPSGGTFVDDADWGARNHQMAMAVLKGEQLRMINLTDGQFDWGGAIINDQGRLRVAVDGPDGKLYVLTDANPGRIFTVDPVP